MKNKNRPIEIKIDVVKLANDLTENNYKEIFDNDFNSSDYNINKKLINKIQKFSTENKNYIIDNYIAIDKPKICYIPISYSFTKSSDKNKLRNNLLYLELFNDNLNIFSEQYTSITDFGMMLFYLLFNDDERFNTYINDFCENNEKTSELLYSILFCMYLYNDDTLTNNILLKLDKYFDKINSSEIYHILTTINIDKYKEIDSYKNIYNKINITELNSLQFLELYPDDTLENIDIYLSIINKSKIHVDDILTYKYNIKSTESLYYFISHVFELYKPKPKTVNNIFIKFFYSTKLFLTKDHYNDKLMQIFTQYKLEVENVKKFMIKNDNSFGYKYPSHFTTNYDEDVEYMFECLNLYDRKIKIDKILK